LKPHWHILGLLQQEADRTLLRDVAAKAGWHLLLTESIDQACQILTAQSVPVVLLDSGFDWRAALARLTAVRPPPSVVLVSPVVDHQVFDQVVHYGGFDVTPQPLEGGELRRITHLALRDWRSRWLPDQTFPERVKNQFG
jgi:DNA-binding NtrC family response regulator